MRLKTLKYFSTLFVVAAALLAGWLVWNYYMQSPGRVMEKFAPSR